LLNIFLIQDIFIIIIIISFKYESNVNIDIKSINTLIEYLDKILLKQEILLESVLDRSSEKIRKILISSVFQGRDIKLNIYQIKKHLFTTRKILDHKKQNIKVFMNKTYSCVLMCVLARFFFHMFHVISSLDNNIFFLCDVIGIFLLSYYLHFIQKNIWKAIGKTWFFCSKNISQEGFLWIEAFFGDKYLSQHIALNNIGFTKNREHLHGHDLSSNRRLLLKVWLQDKFYQDKRKEQNLMSFMPVIEIFNYFFVCFLLLFLTLYYTFKKQLF
jgi:hypothetical protein